MIATRQFGEQEAPAQAFRLEAVQFKAGKAAEDGKTPCSIFARTAGGVEHWYWGMVYHDFSGMSHKDVITIDFLHDDATTIGAADTFRVTPEGLTVEGFLLTVVPGDRTDLLVKQSAAGIPFEASIDFRGDCLIEEIREGFTSQCNGQQVQGPALIIREWSLRSVAICPHGVDPNSRAQFSQDPDDSVAVRIFTEDPMTKTTLTGGKPGKPETQQLQAGDKSAQTGETKTTVSAAEGQQAAPSTEGTAAAPTAGAEPDQRGQFTQELKRYTDKFGAEQGTKWFTEGKSWEQSLEAQNELLQKQIAAGQASETKLKERLQSLSAGEESPAKLSEATGEEQPGESGSVKAQFAHMGKLGAFASGLALPGAQN